MEAALYRENVRNYAEAAFLALSMLPAVLDVDITVHQSPDSLRILSQMLSTDLRFRIERLHIVTRTDTFVDLLKKFPIGFPVLTSLRNLTLQVYTNINHAPPHFSSLNSITAGLPKLQSLTLVRPTGVKGDEINGFIAFVRSFAEVESGSHLEHLHVCTSRFPRPWTACIHRHCWRLYICWSQSTSIHCGCFGLVSTL